MGEPSCAHRTWTHPEDRNDAWWVGNGAFTGALWGGDLPLVAALAIACIAGFLFLGMFTLLRTVYQRRGHR